MRQSSGHWSQDCHCGLNSQYHHFAIYHPWPSEGTLLSFAMIEKNKMNSDLAISVFTQRPTDDPCFWMIWSEVNFIFLIIVRTVVDTVCGHKIVYNDYCKQWPESRVRATYLRSPCYPGCCLGSRTSCWGRCRTWWRGTRGRGAVRTPPRLRISYLKQNIYQDYHHLHSWESITWRD